MFQICSESVSHTLVGFVRLTGNLPFFTILGNGTGKYLYDRLVPFGNPEPKPFTMSTIKIDHWYKMKGGKAYYRIAGIDNNQVCLLPYGNIPFEDLKEKWVHAPTHDAPDDHWLPCTTS